MLLRFTKMHGLGNDFMVLDLVTQHVQLTSHVIQQWANRHTGIGFDQLLVVEPPSSPAVDFNYRIYNANGSEAEQCGNGARCIAKFVQDKKLTGKKHIIVQNLKGLTELTLLDDGQVSVNMGAPDFNPVNTPFLTSEQAKKYTVNVAGQPVEMGVVSMGNPHAVLQVDDIEIAPVAQLGAAVAASAQFPDSVNVGFMQVINSGTIKLRVYERGVGETQACGSGACAAMVVARLWQMVEEQVAVRLPGGELSISWAGDQQSVIMCGPATWVYEGRIRL